MPPVSLTPSQNQPTGGGSVFGTAPPTQPTFTPTCLPASGNASGTITINFGVLSPGDILSDFWMVLSSTASSTDTTDAVTITLQNEHGLKLLDAIVVPGVAQGVSSTNNLFSFNVMIPMLYRAAVNGRKLTLTITVGTNAVRGYAALGVRRNFRPYEQWKS
jgi:hypothetical protein